jgi:hypothetical protein
MPDENGNFLPSDIPHDVVIQEALAPYLGGFEEAREAAEAAYTALAVTYRRAIVEAEELAALQEQLHLIDGMRQQNLDAAAAAIQRAGRAETTIARVRADCEEQTSKPLTDDIVRGIWAQARRTLNILGPGETTKDAP